MIEPTNEQSRKIAALAGRLRVIQAQLADEKPDFRRGQIDHEIEQAVSQIVPQEREPFLNELMSAFPAMGGGEPARTGKGGPAAAPEAPKDPAVALVGHVEGLVKIWTLLNADQRKEVLKSLAQGGVLPQVPTGPNALPGTVLRDFRAKLEIGSHDTPDPQRVMELAAMMLEVVLIVDHSLWWTWTKQISPMSAVRPNGPLKRFLRDFVSNKFDPNQSQSSDPTSVELKRLSEMARAFLFAITKSGKSFGDNFLAQLSPAAIEESVPDSTFRNKDTDCWRLYKSRASSLDLSAIDQAITQCMAKEVEGYVRRAWGATASNASNRPSTP